MRVSSALVAALVLAAGLLVGAVPAGATPDDAPTVGIVGDSIPFEAFEHYDTTIKRDRRITFNEVGLARKIREVLPAVRDAVRAGEMPDIFVAFIGTSESEVDLPSVWRTELRQLLDLVSPAVDCVRVFDIDDTRTGFYRLHDRYGAAYNRITHAVSHEYDNVDWFHYDRWAELVGPEWERRDILHHNVYGRVQIARLMREVTNSCDPALTSGPFWDVPDADPWAPAIAWVGERQLFGGYPNGTYRARVGAFVLPATRGALVNMAWRLAGSPDGYPDHPWNDGRPFVDAALRWAAAARVGTGFADGTFRPGRAVTRAEALSLLWRMAGRPGGFPEDPWTDAEGPAIRWAAANHLLAGVTATTFHPDASLGRGLLARLLFRFDALPRALGGAEPATGGDDDHHLVHHHHDPPAVHHRPGDDGTTTHHHGGAMSTHLVSIVIDANDPHALARWWSEALGWPITYEEENEEVVVEPMDELEDQVPALVFVPVPNAKTTKNRVHLDLASTSPEDQAATVERLLAAGATRADVGQTGDETWVVLADPEGNEFCVLRSSSDGGPLAAFCLDVSDDKVEAEFWIAASGWTVVEQDEEGTSLANPTGRRPHFDLIRVPDPSPGKNRIHIDVAPPKDADHAAEVARLVAAGATPADVGQTGDESWTVLADPEGNEMCVLAVATSPPHPPVGMTL